MTIIEATALINAEIAARCNLPIYDSLNLPQPSLPCVVVVPEATPTSLHGGGSFPTGEQFVSIWIIHPKSTTYTQALSELWDTIQLITLIPRFYADENGWTYGEDIVGRNPKSEVIIAQIKGKVA